MSMHDCARYLYVQICDLGWKMLDSTGCETVPTTEPLNDKVQDHGGPNKDGEELHPISPNLPDL